MNYCHKCEFEYEEECLCPSFRKFMEIGETNAVPMAWKLEYWDGYPNAPKYCDHPFWEEIPMGDGVSCTGCGIERPGDQLADGITRY